eukprot:CAMPEP_0179434644 /NCGR_PEP_ID=MMETSP0799-20121207/18928_1 /TAXON_ID=46947 /ORGANISM="Geminigera cryophila, Strain CCMP2564" /LENGTH=90 /DNA_ID=CAMNT_0021213569 /DNA_START=472 /DNA_END=744 /DNA_ORIENTATION=-
MVWYCALACCCARNTALETSLFAYFVVADSAACTNLGSDEIGLASEGVTAAPSSTEEPDGSKVTMAKRADATIRVKAKLHKASRETRCEE